MVESLFFACLNFNRRTASNSTTSEKEILQMSINALLNGTELERVVQANWMIRDAISHLLKSALAGQRCFSFESTWMDPGSKALYALLVDRLSARLRQYDAGEGDQLSIERPRITNEQLAGNWTCILPTHPPLYLHCLSPSLTPFL
jgi:hypothetical protein